ncbi:DUF5522 domain-containing protein [Emticicia sp. BO119]|uniref:DUF5522 domain-containing protein n=1 Tax=Emticicia sp. BO119 TaxID=2757768 RepID=UPI0015F1003D|nr:DUF5522 domain-containing protein [Emticicia sp. BO119]MBA4852441.1 hypothetical protein [Emticicia sp. BO119]
METRKNKKGDSHLPPLKTEDYYMEGDLMVFTDIYHKKRGYCCKSGCRHCPYGFKKK